VYSACLPKKGFQGRHKWHERTTTT